MAIFHLNVKVGKAGKAHAHAAYISRSGKYESCLEKGERLLATESGNLPKWASENPLKFWHAADENERANGSTYREMEIALPRELNDRQLVDLVRHWVKQELGEKHAFQWAIHIPKAADGGEQPHVHLMFSERQLDGIERDPKTYFKRYNSKAPGKGGARKGYGERAGQTLSQAERIKDLKALRLRWEKTCNDYLHWKTDSKARIDRRSYAERGLDTVAEPKQLPSAWRGEGKAAILEMRAAKAEVKAHWPDIEQYGKILIRRSAATEKDEQAFQAAQHRYEKEQAQETLEKGQLETAVLLEEMTAGSVEPAGTARSKEVAKRWQVRREQLEAEKAAEERTAREAAQKAEAEARQAAEVAMREKTERAKETVKAWDKDVAQRVAHHSERLKHWQTRIGSELKAIDSERKALLDTHQHRKPQAPRFLMSLFKQKEYLQALQVWGASGSVWRRHGKTEKAALNGA